MPAPQTQDPPSCCSVSLIHMAFRPTLQPVGKRMEGERGSFPSRADQAITLFRQACNSKLKLVFWPHLQGMLGNVVLVE